MNSETERADIWLRSMLRGKLVKISFWDSKLREVQQEHVADPETLEEVIRDTWSKMGYRYALLPYHGRWLLMSRHGDRFYDWRAQAEMVAIHGV